ncbi:carbohydrate-binding protein, partial [Pontiellaceae bacterium B1224]|nr:carbohydrate-binding protein [Pontiellaceae bacterium B1224]
FQHRRQKCLLCSEFSIVSALQTKRLLRWDRLYTTVEADLPAVTGQYPLYLRFVVTGDPYTSSIFNLNWFSITRNPVEFEAEAFSAQNGTSLEPCVDIGGGTNVADISNGDWCRYDNLFIASNAVFRARIARPAGRSDGQIEIRTDDLAGALLGTLDVPETGGWQMYETIEVPLSVVSGTYSVFLKFVEDGTSNGGTLFNVNRFSITPSTQVEPPETIHAEAVDADQIDLSWSSQTNASAYNLKRAETSGGPYPERVDGLSVTNHSDLGVLAGTSYYYVVTALYGSAESGVSMEVSAVPSAPLTEGDVVIDQVGIQTNTAGGYYIAVSVDESNLGHNYQVVLSESLLEPDWQAASDVNTGNGGVLQIEVPVEGSRTNCYYKLEAWRQ